MTKKLLLVAALCLLLAVPTVAATPRLNTTFCIAILNPPSDPGLVYDVIRLVEGVVVGGCVVGFNAGNGGLDAADSTCNFLVGHDCTTP
ncbi:MAG: hypothetical protein QOI63_1360 [Thermoplasmata archaeon]|jgi:hypothetical protein|nr:hypothetical protein [Thermoplasmata archaeon]